MPSEEFLAIREAMKEQPAPLAGLTIQEQRVVMEATFLAPLPDDVKYLHVDAGGVSAEWISVPESRADRVLFYLHGGGYVKGSLNTHREMTSRLARVMSARALSVDYRLAPEHPFPAAVDDATTAYRWLLAEGIVEPSGIIIAGDSAGGGLAISCLVALRDAEEPMPALVVCIAPWTDMEGTGESLREMTDEDGINPETIHLMAEAYIGDTDPREPLASPIHADLTGLPPLLIQVSITEALYSDATRLAERARECGVETEMEAWEDMTHVWHMMARLIPEGREAIEDIGRFVRKRLG